MTPHFSICVYCGSRPGINPLFAEAAREVGTWIASHGGQLVYGGGRNGLMGIAADAALAAGGSVIGIIPRALVEKEWAHTGCTELHVVENMHDRKRLMAERSDAFIALPGGIGTLEELFEVWTWKQLAYHDKPIGLLNTAGYYQGMLDFLQHSVKQQFLGDWQMGLLRSAEEPSALLRELVESAGLPHDSRLDQI